MATPYTTSCGIALTSIDGVDCIGDSRGFINNNIQNLGTAICTVSGLTNFNVQDSNTIDLTWQNSTRTLSADVKPDSIRYSNLASWQTLSASPTLSAEAVQPRLAKAWIDFWVTSAGGAVTINSSYNVSSLQYVSAGKWRVNFATPLPTEKYSVFIGDYNDYGALEAGTPPNGSQTVNSFIFGNNVAVNYVNSRLRAIVFHL